MGEPSFYARAFLHDSSDMTYDLIYRTGMPATLYIHPPVPHNTTGFDLELFYAARKEDAFWGFQVPDCFYMTKQTALARTATGWKQYGILSHKGDKDQKVALLYDRQGRLTQYDSDSTTRYSIFAQVTPGVLIPSQVVKEPRTRTTFVSAKATAMRSYRDLKTVMHLQSYDSTKHGDNFFRMQHLAKGTEVCDSRYMLGVNEALNYTYSGKSSIDEESREQFRLPTRGKSKR